VNYLQNQDRVARGMNPDSLREAKKEFEEALGAEWVSDSPAVLTCYHRDFTIIVGNKPQLVVLPSSTEEVQSVVRIAQKHEIPLLVMTTGFNHAGQTVPKRGGILMDLRRMDNILEVDEESMTVTLSPYIRIGPIFEECVKRESTGGMRMMPSSPMTLASISLLSNYVTGGMTEMSYKTGNHHENIVSSTWVLPDGEIFESGPLTFEDFEDKVGVLGPGPDMLGMLLSSDGNFGICTEITIKIFNKFPIEKTFFLEYEDEDERDLDVFCEFFKVICKENFVQDFYKSGNCHAAQVLTEDATDIMESLGVHFLFLNINALDEEELAIKEKRLREIVDSIDGLTFMADESINLFYRAMEIPEGEFTWQMFRKVYKGGRSQRWKGSFNWMAYACKLDQVPELERIHRRLRDKYFATTDPFASKKTIPQGISLQGPMQMGRMCALEFDYYVDPGHPDEMLKFREMVHKLGEDFAQRGVMLGKGTLMHNYQLKRMVPYIDLVRQTKKMLDPNLVMAPGNLPLWDD